MKILVVEDNLVSRTLLQKTLDNRGHEIVTAEDGQQALEILSRGGVKLVIADWMLPGLDGLDLCRKIRQNSDDGYVYFIMLTGKDQKNEIIEGLEVGADDYVTKPFDIEELKVRIRAGERILNLEKELTEKNQRLLQFNNRLEALASIDPLMEIGNRRSFYTTIAKVHDRACRYSQPYGLAICDIDCFKAYNDTYGHMAGDRVLKSAAQAIKETIRTSDEVFRFGGEELVIIMPNQDLEAMKIAAERIKNALSDLEIEHRGSPSGKLSASFGTAVFNDSSAANRWEDILDQADKALYRAKAAGRNRVECFSPAEKTGDTLPVGEKP